MIERFKNPALKHRTGQIAMDGSQKLPQRLLGTIRDRLQTGGAIDRLALGRRGLDAIRDGHRRGRGAIDVRDPMAAKLRALADGAAGEPDRLAKALFGIREIFGDDLPENPAFTVPVIRALRQLFRAGAKNTVAHYPAP